MYLNFIVSEKNILKSDNYSTLDHMSPKTTQASILVNGINYTLHNLSGKSDSAFI